MKYRNTGVWKIQSNYRVESSDYAVDYVFVGTQEEAVEALNNTEVRVGTSLTLYHLHEAVTLASQ